MKGVSSIFPLLLRPKIVAVKNYFSANLYSKSLCARDAVIFGFGAAVMVGIYYGFLWFFRNLHGDMKFVYFHPSLLLGLIFIFLLFMLFLSNCSAALSSLFLAQDLDLVISTPIKRRTFFWGKLLDILISSSWITIVFLLPSLISFQRFYQPSVLYYPMVVAVLLPYFFIPTACSIVFVTLYSRIVPASRTKESLLIISACGLICLGVLLVLAAPESGNLKFGGMQDLVRFVAILSLPNKSWAPSNWATTCIAELLEPTNKDIVPHLILLYSVAIALGSLAFIVFRLFHFSAYSKACSNRQRVYTSSRVLQQVSTSFFPWVSPPLRAIILKEVKIFVRDISQIFQLLLLSGLCVLYFYNFRLLHSMQSEMTGDSSKWWGVFLMMVNGCLEAFLITAAGTRFVFQSVSLEGKAMWILRTSPIELAQLLRAKFFSWYFPIALTLSIIFGLGAYVVHAPLAMIILKILCTWVVCYGIVGLGIGMGAYFANFNWEHSSQLAASFGSLVYMLASIGLIAVDFMLAAMAYFFYQVRFADGGMSTTEFFFGISCLAFLLLYLNYVLVRGVFKIGEESLLEANAR